MQAQQGVHIISTYSKRGLQIHMFRTPLYLYKDPKQVPLQGKIGLVVRVCTFI